MLGISKTKLIAIASILSTLLLGVIVNAVLADPPGFGVGGNF